VSSKADDECGESVWLSSGGVDGLGMAVELRADKAFEAKAFSFARL